MINYCGLKYNFKIILLKILVETHDNSAIFDNKENFDL